MALSRGLVPPQKSTSSSSSAAPMISVSAWAVLGTWICDLSRPIPSEDPAEFMASGTMTGAVVLPSPSEGRGWCLAVIAEGAGTG